MLRLELDPPCPEEAEEAFRHIQRGIDRAAGNQLTFFASGAGLLADAAAIAIRTGIKRMTLVADPGDDMLDVVCEAGGFVKARELLQLRRRLPVGLDAQIDLRPFVPGKDEDAWLEVNNRAFHWHHDQGGWSRADIEAHEREPWFDPAGFLLHESGGRIDGFCWTKIHSGEQTPVGEIYVIATDPDARGKGLGRALTLAGLDWLARQGITVGMLYVESDNIPARRLYQQLGFGITSSKRWYTWLRPDLRPPPGAKRLASSDPHANQ